MPDLLWGLIAGVVAGFVLGFQVAAWAALRDIQRYIREMDDA